MVEAKLKIQERKIPNRNLIQIGGLIVKAKLDDLPINTLFGALLSLKNELIQHPSNQDQWTKIGKSTFNSSNS